MNRFAVDDKNGLSYIASELTRINIFGNDYVVYVIPKDNQNNLYVSKLVNEELQMIQNPKEEKIITEIVEELINKTNENEKERKM